MKRALATYCCCENASKIVSDLISMRCGILTLRQGNVRASGRTVKSPPGLQDNLVLTNEFRHPVTTSIKRVIFNLSELAGYWAHMMRKGTGAPFVIMPDGREGKMVLEYVRWWHQLTFSYFSQGINKLLTFKEQQLPDQERVGSRSPPSHSTCASHCHSVRHKHHPQFIPHSSFSKVALCFFAFVLGNVKRFSR